MSKEIEIDLKEIFRNIHKNIKKIIYVSILSFLLGFICTGFIDNVYKSSSVFYPHYEEVSNTSTIKNLAGLAGINLDSEQQSSIPTSLYPKLIQSISFKKRLLDQIIISENEKITYKKYLLNENKVDFFKNFFNKLILNIRKLIGQNLDQNDSIKLNKNLIIISNEDYDLFKLLDERIKINLNEKDGFIELNIFDKNPIVSSIIAKKAQEILQQNIINFKIKNIKDVFEFTEEQLKISKNIFYKLQDSLANFKDSNIFINSDLFKNRLSRIESEVNIAKNIYNELAINKERIEIDVRKNTPIFTIINPVVVPNVKDYPKRSLITIIITLISTFSYIIIIIFKKNIKKTYHSIIK